MVNPLVPSIVVSLNVLPFRASCNIGLPLASVNETCPVFPGKVRHRLHMGFDDPSGATGTYIEILNEFYRVRNEIRDEFYKLYETELRKKL